ncbi:DUF4025 domain-containing protein [Paraliobacillus sp. JSM ZJ581]
MTKKQMKTLKSAQENEQSQQKLEKEGMEITRQQIQNNYMEGTIDQIRD